jgi:hypothetical protein
MTAQRPKEALMARLKWIAPALLIAVAAAGACKSSNPAPPVPVAGTDMSALHGKWEGEYSSPETGRTGSINFELKAFEKYARGDVLMVPKDAYASSSPDKGPGAVAKMPQVLQINFVNTTAGSLTGTMDPYLDPRCNCQVQTTFTGTIAGDTIEGTFQTVPEGDFPVTNGTWKMHRVKK